MNSIIKNFIFIFLGLVLITNFSNCASKGSDIPQEEKIAFSINPDPGATILAALGTTQNVSINVISALPSGGVIASISATQETDNAVVFNQTLNSTTANFSTTIQNLKSGIVCNVAITITSKSTATNSAIKTFKIAMK